MASRMKIGLTGISFKNFWGFQQDQYKGRIADMKRLAGKLGAGFVCTPTTFENHTQAAAAARAVNKADLAILDVAAYPEGKAAQAFFDGIKVPLVLWSRNETLHRVNMGHNSFCGANFLGGCLALRNIRFRAIHGPTTDETLVARLRTAVRLIAAAKASAGARIGMFGEGIVPKFYDIDVSAKDRQALKDRYDIRFVNVRIKDVIKRAQSYRDSAIARKAAKFAGYFSTVKIPADALAKQARLLQAFGDMSAEGGYDAINIRCWPDFQSLYSAWPCPSLGILNDAGLPTACEGDVCGALDMLLMSKMTKVPTTLLDVVDWDDRKNTFGVWHCGPTAPSWAQGKTSLIPHNVDGRNRDGSAKDGLPAVIDMQFAPGKMTMLRTLGALDDEFALQGQFITAPSRHICGSMGTVAGATSYGREVSNGSVRETMMSRTLPHHYAVARGHLFA